MNVKKLYHEDIRHFEAMIVLFENVFEMKNFVMPEQGHLRKLLAKEDFHVFVALADGAVIGGLTAYTLLQYYSVKPLAYIFDLAVSVDHQRQGIGQALIAEANRYFQEHGYEEVFVQADQVDTYALDFYRKTFPTGEQDVSHFYYLLNN